MARNRLIAPILLLLAVSAGTQVNQRAPNIIIHLPSEVSSDKVGLSGYLYGAFGAFGIGVRAAQNVRSVTIHSVVKGKVADRLKLFAWAPGCRIATFDIAVGLSDVEESYSCRPLPTVTLLGQVDAGNMPQTKPAEVQVSYSADWACNFFGLLDCRIPQIRLGTAKLEPNGYFEIRLPDFHADPTSSGPNGATFQLVLSEIKTLNVIGWLQPESASLLNGNGLKPASSYPRPVVFVVQKPVRRI